MAGQPGSALLETVEVGKSLIAAYTKFISYRKIADGRFDNLYATLSITNSAISELGDAINKYKEYFTVEEHVTKSLNDTCKANFEKLLVMVNEGSEGGLWKTDGIIGGISVTAEIDPWLLVTMALGNAEEIRVFWHSMDDVRDEFVEMNDVVKYMALKAKKEKEGLTTDEAELLKVQTALLPHVLQRRKMIQSRKQNEVERLERLARVRRPLERRNSEFSDMTLAVEESKRQQNPEPFLAKNIDFDAQSVYSYYSVEPSSGMNKAVADADEVYEEWSLRYQAPLKDLNRSKSFLGLKFKAYFEDPGYWQTQPELRTQAEMKDQEEIAKAKLTPEQHLKAMQKIVQGIPKDGGYQVDFLLDQRMTSTNNEHAKRQWTVVAIKPKQRYTYSSSKKLGKDPLTTEWLVTIKGETIDKETRTRSYRGKDPWRKPYREARRDYYPDDEIIIERNPNRRSRYDHHAPVYVDDRTPVRRRERVYDDGFRTPVYPAVTSRFPVAEEERFHHGAVTVGKILSKEKAMEQIEEIWTEISSVKPVQGEKNEIGSK